MKALQSMQTYIEAMEEILLGIRQDLKEIRLEQKQVIEK